MFIHARAKWSAPCAVKQNLTGLFRSLSRSLEGRVQSLIEISVKTGEAAACYGLGSFELSHQYAGSHTGQITYCVQ